MTTKLLTLNEVGEIEARARVASPYYVIDWSKGEHALLQVSGWRPANEEQPRTIAAFDKDDGYLDLLFCAEARTDIPALCATVRELEARVSQWKQAVEGLTPNGSEFVDDPEKCAAYLRQRISYPKQIIELRNQLAAAEQERDGLARKLRTTEEIRVGLKTLAGDYEEEISKLKQERDGLRDELATEKRLRSELKEIAQAGIAEVSSVGSALQENVLNDFRTHAINLCREKATEWEGREDPLGAVEANAARVIANELEALK